MSRRRGFTLLELLIVLALVALLAAFLLPLIGKAVENGRRTSCMSNMRQLHAAYVRYSADYEEATFLCDLLIVQRAQAGVPLPITQPSTIDGLTNYVGDVRIFHCPSDLRPDSPRSYSINDYLGGTFPAPVRHVRYLSQVPNSAETFMWIEETPPSTLNGYTGGFVVWPYPRSWIVDQPAALHNGGSCIIFVDGHCEYWHWDDPTTTAPLTRIPPVPMLQNTDIPRLQRIDGSSKVPN